MNQEELINQFRSLIERNRSTYLEELNRTQHQMEKLLSGYKGVSTSLSTNAGLNANTDSSRIQNKTSAKQVYNENILLGDNETKELSTIRISEELLTKEKAFISSVFKNEILKQDKNSKTYFASVSQSVIKVAADVLKLIKGTNGIYSVNTIIDFFVLQILSLEFFFKASNSDKAVLIEKMKHLEEENRDLKTKGNEEQFKVFEAEINKIKNMLIQRSKEFSKEFTDAESKKIMLKTDKLIEELLEQNKALLEQNMKIKSHISEIVDAHKTGDNSQLNHLLTNLSKTSFDFSEPHHFTKESIEREFYENKRGSQSAVTVGINTKKSLKADFVDRVINEFDKILDDESRRVDKYFNKDNPANKRKSTLPLQTQRRRTTSTGKNYVEWKPQGKWEDELRGGGKSEEKNRERSPSESYDIKTLATQTKSKLRQSVISGTPEHTALNTPSPSNYTLINQKSEKAMNMQEVNEPEDFGEDYKQEKVSYNSPIKKINRAKKEKQAREQFESSIRSMLYQHHNKK